MRKYSLIFLVSYLIVSFCFAYSPIIDGALADIQLRVVDENGLPVSDANVSVAFYISPSKSKNQIGKTNSNGIFTVRGNTIGEITVWVYKDGYYDSRIVPIFETLNDSEVKKHRRWSLKTEKTKVVLKKKQFPIKMAFHLVDSMDIPATNKIVGLDLEKLQWCPPYGKGRFNDVDIIYESWRSPTNWFCFSRKLSVLFPHSADGFYRVRRENFSTFKYAYQAQTNVIFEKSFKINFERSYEKILTDERFSKDEYLIFRTRTETNSLGQVIRANYGRIGEDLDHMFGLRIRSWFNQIENDTNLEDSRLSP